MWDNLVKALDFKICFCRTVVLPLCSLINKFLTEPHIFLYRLHLLHSNWLINLITCTTVIDNSRLAKYKTEKRRTGEGRILSKGERKKREKEEEGKDQIEQRKRPEFREVVNKLYSKTPM